MKKKIIIGMCILIGVIALSGLIGWGVYKFNSGDSNTEDETKVNEKWAKSYYEILKDEDEIVPEKSKNTSLSFIELDEDETPAMIIRYELDKEINLIIYFTDKNNEVQKIKFSYPVDLKILYDIENEKTNYYLEYKKGDDYYYQKLTSKINLASEGDNDTSLPGEAISRKKRTIKDKDDNKYEISDFDLKYIEYDSIEYEDIDLVDIKKEKLKNIINDATEKLLNLDDYGTKKIKDKIEEIEENIEKIKEIEEEEKKEEEVKKFYNSIKQPYCLLDTNSYECIELSKEDGKYYFSDYVPFSEAGYYDEIKDIELKKENIYTLKFDERDLEVDISDIKNGYIYVNNRKFTAIKSSEYGPDLDDMVDKLGAL